MAYRHKWLHLLPQLLICSSVYSLLSSSSSQRQLVHQIQSLPIEIHGDSNTIRQSAIEQINLNNQLSSYSFHWESLLTKEYQDTLAELQLRRKSYTKSQLEASGLSLFNAVATPETELYGEKIVRISLFHRTHSKYDNNGGSEKLREKFKRGDVLVMTPLIQFRGRDITPREGMIVDFQYLNYLVMHSNYLKCIVVFIILGLVMEVGPDYLTLGVGSSWPAGVMEMRKHDNYNVRLDKSISSVPLRAQRLSLEKLRKGQGGYAANSIVQLFYESSQKYLNAAKEMPSHFSDDMEKTKPFDLQVKDALKEAMSHMTFKPNDSQQKAVSWALKRKISIIRGPPGTDLFMIENCSKRCTQ